MDARSSVNELGKVAGLRQGRFAAVSEVTAHDRSGKPDKTSWDMMQQVAPHREEPLLGGNAHSARYGEMIHDGWGKPEKLNHQEEANSENFVMGSDATEFVNKLKEQERNRQKMSNVAESGEEHSIILWNVHGCDDECSDIHGKEFLNYSKFHQELCEPQCIHTYLFLQSLW